MIQFKDMLQLLSKIPLHHNIPFKTCMEEVFELSLSNSLLFLAPTGALERLMSVRSFVFSSGLSFSKAINLHHSGSRKA